MPFEWSSDVGRADWWTRVLHPFAQDVGSLVPDVFPPTHACCTLQTSGVQLALEEMAARSPGTQLFGLPVEVPHWSGFGLRSLASPATRGPRFEPVAPAYVNVPVDVGRTLP